MREPLRDKERLNHMLAAIERVIRYTSGKAFDDLTSCLDAIGINYVIDPSIVRGLDYYTKTAFEFITTKIGSQGTVCGGGRYIL